MIIQINATVCAAVDHGDDEAAQDRWQRPVQEGAGRSEKAAVTRRNKKLRERGRNVGSSAGLTIAATTIYGALEMVAVMDGHRLRLTGPFVACDLSATA